jgi:mono/diheme cytochrome c family protein
MSQMHERERADPDENNRPLPGLMVMFIGAMVMWGSFYIYSTAGGGASALGDQRTVSTLMPKPVDPSASINGKEVYAAKCAACHQATGTGVAGVFPPLAKSEWVVGDAKALGQILLHGIEGPLEVLGVSYNGAMPAFGAQLSDAEIAAVMTTIRSEWGNTATPVDAAFVGQLRESSQSRTAAFEGQAGLEAFLTTQAN